MTARPFPFTPDLDAEILAMWFSGGSLQLISARTGVPATTLFRRVRALFLWRPRRVQGRPVVWTPDLIAQIVEWRAGGMSYVEMGRRLGCSPSVIGRHLPPIAPQQPRQSWRERRDAEIRAALPPGHAASWGAINSGTVLDGARFDGVEVLAVRVDPR